MKTNYELAKKLLKNKYDLTEDGTEFKLQYPIMVMDLAFIMQKYTNEQLILHGVAERIEQLKCICKKAKFKGKEKIYYLIYFISLVTSVAFLIIKVL